MSNHDAVMPAIGAHVRVLRNDVSDGDAFHYAIVVGHLTDPVLGSVLELRLSDSRRLQRIWPSPTIQLGSS